MRSVENLGSRIAVGKEKKWKIGEIHPIGFEGKYRDWTDYEKRPFGAHRYVILNGDRKGIELKGIFIGSSVYYALKEKGNKVKVFAVNES